MVIGWGMDVLMDLNFGIFNASVIPFSAANANSCVLLPHGRSWRCALNGFESGIPSLSFNMRLSRLKFLFSGRFSAFYACDRDDELSAKCKESFIIILSVVCLSLTEASVPQINLATSWPF